MNYLYGQTPIDVIQENLPTIYQISLKNEQAKLFVELDVNDPSDNDEKITVKLRDLLTHRRLDLHGDFKLEGHISKKGMQCLLRRLATSKNNQSKAIRCSILQSIGISEL